MIAANETSGMTDKQAVLQRWPEAYEGIEYIWTRPSFDEDVIFLGETWADARNRLFPPTPVEAEPKTLVDATWTGIWCADKRTQRCTCLGSCRRRDGARLGDGWHCVLTENNSVISPAPTSQPSALVAHEAIASVDWFLAGIIPHEHRERLQLIRAALVAGGAQ